MFFYTAIMICFVRFVLVINIVSIHIYVAVAQEIVNSNLCWNANIQCNIEAHLTRNLLTTPFLVNFNCTDVDHLASHNDGIRQIKGIQRIQLNGCHVPESDTIGVEYVDDPKSVSHLTLSFFKTKTFYSKHLDKFKFLEYLQLSNNVFEELTDQSFQNIISVETVVISNNNLKVIAPHAMVPLINLKNLTIVEPSLVVDALNYTFCYSLERMCLEVYEYKWQLLPTSLQSLEINNTKLTFSSKPFAIEDCKNLTVLTITNSQFIGFPSIKSSSLSILNLTRNNLHQLFKNDLPNLEILDLTGNQLKVIDAYTLKSMLHLREMYANNNRIEKISQKAFDSNTHLEIIKISGNRLKSIEFTDHLAERPLKMFIDNNPWSCMWVINVSSEYPTVFSIFQYNKYSNKLNVNGLHCLYYDVDGYNVYESSVATEIIPISSTLPFAENIEILYRRNPKDTALITLIILVVGVAVLFFLLYLHIRCRQNTVEPFYRSLPYDTHQMSDRIDIIRRNLPSTDYEAPIATRDAEVIYEQIPEKFTNYERIPEKFTIHEDGFDDVNSVLSYKIAMKNSES